MQNDCTHFLSFCKLKREQKQTSMKDMKTMKNKNMRNNRQTIATQNLKVLLNKPVELCPIVGLTETGLPIVKVYFKKVLLYFVLDSGAHQNILDVRVYDLLKEQLKTLAQQGNIVGFEGQEHNIQQKISMKFRLQKNTFEEEFSAVLVPGFDYMEGLTGIRVHGILGSGFFTQHKLILDYFQKMVYMAHNHRNSHAQRNKYVELFPLLGLKEAGLPIVVAYFKNVRFQFLLDTGAENNIIDTAVYEQLKDRLKLSPVQGGKIVGFEGQQHEYGQRVSMKIEILDHIFDTEFSILEVPGFNYVEESLGIHLDGLLASEFIAKQKLIIDYSRRMIYMKSKSTLRAK